MQWLSAKAADRGAGGDFRRSSYNHMRNELREQKSQTLFERCNREFVRDFMFSVNGTFMIVCDEDVAVVLYGTFKHKCKRQNSHLLNSG